MTTPATMRAARFDAATRSLSVQDVPVPEPGPNDVLVRVMACGICLSDVHLIDGSLPGPLPVVTPGHEAAGIVERAGELVPGLEGRRPGAPGRRQALPDLRHLRPRPVRGVPGVRDHGLQLRRRLGAVRRGARAGPHRRSRTTCPSSRPASSPTRSRRRTRRSPPGPALRPGESIGLWGIGGLGVHAVQVARLVGATPVIAVDPLPSARERALALGADVALDPTTEDVPARVRELTGGRGLDVAVDLVGANVVLAQAVASLGRFGRAVMVGLSLDDVQLGPGVFFGILSQSLLGHLGYQKQHLDELVDLVRTGRLTSRRRSAA